MKREEKVPQVVLPVGEYLAPSVKIMDIKPVSMMCISNGINPMEEDDPLNF